jgi:WD40 repeat protein
MRLISASGPRVEVFDLDGGAPTKRELGSVMGSNSIKPIYSLEGHDGVEDIAFKNNEVWLTGGQDKEIAVWDYRMRCNTYKIKGIHDNDINCLSVRDNMILSGGEEGRINVIDDRTFKLLYQK